MDTIFEVFWSQGDPWQVERVDGEDKPASPGVGQSTFLPLFFTIGIIHNKTGIKDPFSRLSGFLTSGAPSAASTWSSRMRSLHHLGILTDIRWPFPKEGVKTGVIPGDRQHGDEIQADLLHPQPWRPHPIQPGPHCVHWPKEVAAVISRDIYFDEGGFEMQGSTSRWLRLAPLQGFNSKLKGSFLLLPGFVSGSPSDVGGRL